MPHFNSVLYPLKFYSFLKYKKRAENSAPDKQKTKLLELPKNTALVLFRDRMVQINCLLCYFTGYYIMFSDKYKVIKFVEVLKQILNLS